MAREFSRKHRVAEELKRELGILITTEVKDPRVRLVAITAVEVFDVKQSMRNGGGPACLRLRVVLNDDELKAINRGVLLTDELYERLTTWVEAHYRDELSQNELGDPMLLEEVRKALDELTGIMGLGSIYDFQL